jgi:hypothetical protein
MTEQTIWLTANLVNAAKGTSFADLFRSFVSQSTTNFSQDSKTGRACIPSWNSEVREVAKQLGIAVECNISKAGRTSKNRIA